MSSRLVSLLGAKKPKEYGELADILYEEGVLDDASRRSFKDMIRFRNMLIHVYAKVSPSIVYEIAKELLERKHRRLLYAREFNEFQKVADQLMIRWSQELAQGFFNSKIFSI